MYNIIIIVINNNWNSLILVIMVKTASGLYFSLKSDILRHSIGQREAKHCFLFVYIPPYSHSFSYSHHPILPPSGFGGTQEFTSWVASCKLQSAQLYLPVRSPQATHTHTLINTNIHRPCVSVCLCVQVSKWGPELLSQQQDERAKLGHCIWTKHPPSQSWRSTKHHGR